MTRLTLIALCLLCAGAWGATTYTSEDPVPFVSVKATNPSGFNIGASAFPTGTLLDTYTSSGITRVTCDISYLYNLNGAAASITVWLVYADGTATSYIWNQTVTKPTATDVADGFTPMGPKTCANGATLKLYAYSSNASDTSAGFAIRWLNEWSVPLTGDAYVAALTTAPAGVTSYISGLALATHTDAITTAPASVTSYIYGLGLSTAIANVPSYVWGGNGTAVRTITGGGPVSVTPAPPTLAQIEAGILSNTAYPIATSSGGYVQLAVTPSTSADVASAVAPLSTSAEVATVGANVLLNSPAYMWRFNGTGNMADKLLAVYNVAPAYTPAVNASGYVTASDTKLLNGATPNNATQLVQRDNPVSLSDMETNLPAFFWGFNGTSIQSDKLNAIYVLRPDYKPSIDSTGAVKLTTAYDAAKSAASQTSVNAIPTTPLLTGDGRLPVSGVIAVQGDKMDIVDSPSNTGATAFAQIFYDHPFSSCTTSSSIGERWHRWFATGRLGGN